MKKLFRYLTSSLLVVAMFFTMTVNTAKAEDKPYIIQYNQKDSTYDKANNNTFTLYFDIPEEAKNYQSVELDLSTAMIDGINSKISMPGDHFNFDIKIRNQSGVTFQYMNNSLNVIDPAMEGGDKTNNWGLKSFSGALLDNNLVPYRTANPIAIYKGLFNKTRSSQVTGLDMAKIYDTLKEKGYTQKNALTQYLLDYYNNPANNYNPDGIEATRIADLDTVALKSLFSNGMTSNGSYTITDKDYATLSEEQKSSIQHVSGTKYRFRETEKELSEYYYNYFYDWCVGLQFGEYTTNVSANGTLEKRTVSTSSIMKLYNDKNQVKTKANQYIASQLNEEHLASDLEAKFIVGYTLDGPLAGNNVQCYDYGFRTNIKLEQVISEGSVTIHKTLDLNGYDTNDTPSFIFKLTDSKGIEHIQVMSFDEGQKDNKIVFENIPLGAYSVEEIDSIRYEAVDGFVRKGNITSQNPNYTVEFVNKKEKDDDFSDNNVVVNSFKKTENGVEISQTRH